MFRVVIGYMKEIALLKLVTTSDGMVRNVETEEATQLERELVVLPKLSTTLLRFVIERELVILPKLSTTLLRFVIERELVYYLNCPLHCSGLL